MLHVVIIVAEDVIQYDQWMDAMADLGLQSSPEAHKVVVVLRSKAMAVPMTAVVAGVEAVMLDTALGDHLEVLVVALALAEGYSILVRPSEGVSVVGDTGESANTGEGNWLVEESRRIRVVVLVEEEDEWSWWKKKK